MLIVVERSLLAEVSHDEGMLNENREGPFAARLTTRIAAFVDQQMLRRCKNLSLEK